MAKILRVCTSEFLPPIKERNNSYIYFVYDKMTIFLGQNRYTDPFCIVEELPANPVEGMLYITLEGEVKSYHDMKIIDIGYIEDPEQLQYLYDAGTTYFMKAEYRYLDQQSRLLILPFQNGSYQLSVSAANNIKIDKNTIIKFNPITNRFELYGDSYIDTTNLDGKLSGDTTETVSTRIEDGIIRADLKLSEKNGNILKIFGNGIYANIGDIATTEQVENLALLYENYSTSVAALMNEIREEMDEKGYNITEDSLSAKILESLEQYKPDIADMFDKYQYIYNQLGYIRDSSVRYTDDKIDSAKEEIISYIRNITNAWQPMEIDESITDESFLSEEEAEIIAIALENARAEIMAKRELESTYSVDTDLFVLTDENGIEQVEYHTLPESLNIISEAGSKVGYSYIKVSPEIESGNRVFYKLGKDIPNSGDNIDGLGYTEWDLISQIMINDNKVYTMVETDKDMKAKKYGIFTASSRLENPKELDILKITSVEGTSEGYSKLFILPAKETGNVYMFKEATTVPEYNSILSEDYTLWDGNSEFSAEYDKQLIAFVECTQDLHRVLKFGMVHIDTANELLKLLEVTTEYGDNVLSTIISDVFPEKTSDALYFYKVGTDIHIPELNSYISEDNNWLSYSIGSEIQLSDFVDNIVLVETDSNNKVKKATVITSAKINNLLESNLSYINTEYKKNLVSFNQYDGSTLYYYIPEDLTKVDELQYGDNITDNYIRSEDNIISIEPNRSIVLAEVINNTIVRRFCITKPAIQYSESIDIVASKLEDGDITVTNIPLSMDYNYYFQLLITDNDNKYLLNEPIEKDLFVSWDGSSIIQTGDSTDIIAIKVIITDKSDRIIMVGKSSL